MIILTMNDNQYDIFPNDSVKSYDHIPVGTYRVCANKSGFYLEKTSNLDYNDKVYGNTMARVEKTFNAFKYKDSSLGVLMSGDKGMGKSLCARLMCARAIEEGMPVLIIERAYGGLSSFISSIDQEVCVFFDEFEKTFGAKDDHEGTGLDPKTEMLSLLDGVSISKNLYILTCNSTYSLDYFLARPGRIHYHFQFKYPSPQEIREYLIDNVKEDKISEEKINSVISYSYVRKLNYDHLNAICFELNTAEEIYLDDLNIQSDHNNDRYDVVLTTSMGIFNYSFESYEQPHIGNPNDNRIIKIKDEKRNNIFYIEISFGNATTSDGITFDIPIKDIKIDEILNNNYKDIKILSLTMTKREPFSYTNKYLAI